MKATDIRSKFLKYFEKQGHTRVNSSPLIPQNDPTLLFTNAGMVQFKDAFLGKENRGYTRATSSQKCVRAGGKHNDLENVGFTARHHTFFEMLGNFSFGDYFKEDAIRFAWDFVTNELKIPRDRLYVTVYNDDDEAAKLWEKIAGVEKDRIYRFGEKDNFWSMGDTGPCGPCSEIFYDRGEKYNTGNPELDQMGGEGDRFMEIWNLVFMQFDRDASGKLTPLPKPSVDTGAGLERLASVLQDADTNYDTDLFQNIIQKISEVSQRPYQPQAQDAVSFRVIADHARATTFLIGDGVMPSNEGRGYVLRRIMRRAIRHGKKLGLEKNFFDQIANFVIDQMNDAYPDLNDKRELIRKATTTEETLFRKTLDRGLTLLDDELKKLGQSKTLSGEVAFKLYDTYGFPLDLTRVILEEKGLQIDEEGFETSMERQRSESRKNWKGSGEEAVDGMHLEIAEQLKAIGKLPEFVGYEKNKAIGKCLGLMAMTEGGLRLAKEIRSGTDDDGSFQAIFDVTPFYAESGGQVGDRGRISGDDGFKGEVLDVQKPAEGLIVLHIRPLEGTIRKGETYLQETAMEVRNLTARNHTATHMLHWALREVLGTHVKQAGSLVTPDLMRFDFSHFEGMTPEQIQKVEDLVNQRIWTNHPVAVNLMSKDDAVNSGAIAFFGEKYGDEVRVVRVGEFSTELCGGTHVERSGDIHLFKIQSESGIASGVRRIIAYTSEGAYRYLRERDTEVKQVRDRLKASSTTEIMAKLDKLSANERALQKEVAKLQSKLAGSEVDDLVANAVEIGKVALISGEVISDPTGIKKLREISDRVKEKKKNAVMVLGMKDTESGKAFLLASKGKEAPASVKANEIIKSLSPAIDGKGGGKPDLAQAGGSNPSGLKKALDEAQSIVSGMLE